MEGRGEGEIWYGPWAMLKYNEGGKAELTDLRFPNEPKAQGGQAHRPMEGRDPPVKVSRKRNELD